MNHERAMSALVRPLPALRRAVVASLVVLGLAAAWAGVSHAQLIHVALNPPESVVAVGDTVELEIRVVEPGVAFNGYDAVVTYDPAILTFLPRSPLSLQEGSYMKGACGNTFHRFTASGDSLVIAHVLLCSGISLTGPGQLYKLRFRVDQPVDSWVRFRPGRLRFYNAGLFVGPVVFEDALIRTGVVGVGSGGTPGRVSLAAAPNPAPAGHLTFTLESPVAGAQELTIHDVRGRLVRRFDLGVQAAGVHRVAWDGADSSGRRMPPGIYLASLRTAAGTAKARVTLQASTR